MNRICIIGGGASGVSVLCELIRVIASRRENSEASFEISLYETARTYGTGLAYGTNLDAHILNMPSFSVSAIAEDPGHFYQWLKESKNATCQGTLETDFVPRRVFGIYLRELFNSTLIEAERAGVPVNLVNEEVLSIAETESHVSVTAGAEVRAYDYAILCLGNQPPTFGQHLRGIPGYFHHAWPEKELIDGIPNNSSVVVIGSSLTAVDVLITLGAKKHVGSIALASRHGLLPKVRSLEIPYEPTILTRNNIESIARFGSFTLEKAAQLFVQEFEIAGVRMPTSWPLIVPPNNSALETLREDIEFAENSTAPNYFSILKAADEVVGYIWNALPLSDKKRFEHDYRAIWNAHSYSMPLPNARKVLKAMESGQLMVMGGFKDVSYNYRSNMFDLAFKNDSGHFLAHYKYVVNATGPGISLAEMDSAIIKNGLANGVLSEHPLGGLDVDFGTCAVRGFTGRFSEKIFAVGSLTKGVHFYTNSINENAKCGNRIVERITTSESRRTYEGELWGHDEVEKSRAVRRF